MIQGFKSKDTEALFHDRMVLKFKAFERIARRKLLMLNQAKSLQDLSAVPGNHLERLKGNRKDEHSVRINDQWRVTFKWGDHGPYDVAIEDYH